MSEMDPGYDKDAMIGEHLSEEDQEVLKHWRDSLMLLDPRYHEKDLAKLVARSISDPEFRARLVEDTEAVLAEEEADLPDWLEVRFLSNTPNVLNVVLPPAAGEVEERPAALRDSLRSRTEMAFPWFNDNFNIGDPHTKDHLFPPIPEKPTPWPI